MASLFGERLRALRRAAGLTQEELAERAGLTVAGVSAIERGTRVRTYRRTVEALADALGLAGEDRAAFHGLARRPGPSETLAPRAEPALPAQLTSFVGRDADRARIGSLLESARLVTLTGPGGIGKTRLALTAAADAGALFPAGTGVADLGPVLDGELVPYVVARSVHPAWRSPDPPLELAAARIGESRLLLVLDNCEHLADAAAAAAARLLEHCPRLVILATSREPLRVPGEVTVRVGPLSAGDSAALLRSRAACAAGAEPHLPDHEAMQPLLARLEGIPLAIELAAAALRVFTPAQILGELDGGLRALTLGSRVAPPRQHSLDAAIGWSYELLAPEERLLWRRLSVFAGGFELGAAADVCSSPELPAARVPVVLAALVDKSVIQREESGRFRMLEVVRQFGWRLLSADGEEQALARRHRDWAAALAWPKPEAFWRPEEADWRARLEREQANLRAALDACVRAGDARTGLAIFTGLYGLPQAPAGFGEGLHWLEVLIGLDGPEDDIRALALGSAAWMRAVTGDLQGAMRAGQTAERIARAIGDDSALALALQNLAFAHLTAGQAREAIDAAAGAVQAHRAAGNQWGVAGALHHLAYAHYLAGEGRQSRALAEQAVQMCEAAGNQRFRSAISVLLALLAWQDGEEAAAASLARDTISSADAAADQWNISRAMQLLGWSAAAAGQPERVAMLFGGAQSLLDSTHDHSDLAALPPQREAEAVARRALGEDGYARCFASGYRMPAADAVRYALDR